MPLGPRGAAAALPRAERVLALAPPGLPHELGLRSLVGGAQGVAGAHQQGGWRLGRQVGAKWPSRARLGPSWTRFWRQDGLQEELFSQLLLVVHIKLPELKMFAEFLL